MAVGEEHATLSDAVSADCFSSNPVMPYFDLKKDRVQLGRKRKRSGVLGSPINASSGCGARIYFVKAVKSST